jgi:hypothetical protein
MTKIRGYKNFKHGSLAIYPMLEVEAEEVEGEALGAVRRAMAEDGVLAEDSPCELSISESRGVELWRGEGDLSGRLAVSRGAEELGDYRLRVDLRQSAPGALQMKYLEVEFGGEGELERLSDLCSL